VLATSNIIALMMDAAYAFETLVDLYLSTRRSNPEDRHFHARRHENLKSHLTARI
jgi:hypothetical protein